MNEVEKNNKPNIFLLVVIIIYLVLIFILSRLDFDDKEFGLMFLSFVLLPPMVIFSFILGVVKITNKVKFLTLLFSIFLTYLFYFTSSYKKVFPEESGLGFILVFSIIPFVVGCFASLFYYKINPFLFIIWTFLLFIISVYLSSFLVGFLIIK